MAKAKGSPKTGGRKKGSTNVDNRPLKEMILGALDKAGGIEYLYQQAQSQPAAFLTLIGKVLPTTLASDKDNPINAPVFQLIVGNDQSKQTT